MQDDELIFYSYDVLWSIQAFLTIVPKIDVE